MGDRRSVVVEFNEEVSVALYTHSTGSELPALLAKALDESRGRWTDPAYATRMIFSRMVEENLMGETGFGIEPFLAGTNRYCEASPGFDLVVNFYDKTVEGDDSGTGKSYSFEDFILKFHPDGRGAL